MRYQGYASHGPRGSVTQLQINGVLYTADSVTGDGDVKEIAKFERTLGDSIAWQRQPLAGDMTADEIDHYTGAK